MQAATSLYWFVVPFFVLAVEVLGWISNGHVSIVRAAASAVLSCLVTFAVYRLVPLSTARGRGVATATLVTTFWLWTSLLAQEGVMRSVLSALLFGALYIGANLIVIRLQNRGGPQGQRRRDTSGNP